MERPQIEKLKKDLQEARHAECVIRDALEDCTNYLSHMRCAMNEVRELLEPYLTRTPEPPAVE